MYSVVLMMAVTVGGETPDLGGRGCRGCSGCWGGSGCFGGGGWGGCRGGRRCHGCAGGCYASYGCYGGGYGCYGGGCYGGGCYGGGYGCCGGVVVVGCHGCHGGMPPATGGKAIEKPKNGGEKPKNGETAQDDKLKAGTPLSAEEQKWLKEMMDAESDATEKEKLDKEYKADSRIGRKASYEVFKKMKDKDKDKDGEVSLRPEPATLVVSLPATARLTVDGTPTRSTSGLRTFTSPTLEPGKTYAYTLTASYTREGQPVSVTKRVQIEAGQTIKVSLHSATAVASR